MHILTEDNFMMYAAKHYTNPCCHDMQEFFEDLKRFIYIKKLIRRFKNQSDLKERLILNHIVVVYNCFGLQATPMLFFKLKEYHKELCTFLAYLNLLPETVKYDGVMLLTASVGRDAEIEKRLANL